TALVAASFGGPHGQPGPDHQPQRGRDRERIGAVDEQPLVKVFAHDQASSARRRRRASACISASSARIRSSTTPPKIRLKPSVATSRPHRKGPAIAEPPVVMLGGWCRLCHQMTEKWMIGILTAPTSPKIAGIRLDPPSRATAPESPM